MFTDSELSRRKPVWSVLSDLWLDNELHDHDLSRIANVLFESGYSKKKLKMIYEQEVAPVVYTNLLNPAGEWAGFEDEWLHKQILISLNSRTKWNRLMLRLKQVLMFHATKQYWNDIEIRLDLLKNNSNI